MERVGVIGLGRMGCAIAQRMAGKGYEVLGWTRSGRAVDGVENAPDLAALVAESQTLILSLLDDAAVAGTLDALLGLDLSGRQIIETSTVTPGVLTARIAAIAGKGATAVDAPISGGPEMVLAGTCGIFIGGEAAAADRAAASLSAISGRIAHVGPLGTGLVMKVINNGMLQVYVQGLAELLPLAKAAGLPLETALRILTAGPAGLPMVRDRLPKILGQDETVGFAARGTFKDNAVSRHVLESYGLRSTVLEAYAAEAEAVAAAGLMDEDVAQMICHAYSSEA